VKDAPEERAVKPLLLVAPTFVPLKQGIDPHIGVTFMLPPSSVPNHPIVVSS